MTSQQLQNLIDRLRQKGWHLATAESCTGGLLAKTLTDQPGVSDVFECGMICYSNRIKQEKLHIPEAFLRDYGAVSEHVVRAMSTSISEYAPADIGIGITGVAGPDRSEDKPVGLVYISVYIKPQNVLHSSQLLLEGNRDQIRQAAVDTVLEQLDSMV